MAQFVRGDKIQVKRPFQRTITGKVTRVFYFPPELGIPSNVEYRSFFNGGLYITKETQCMPYDRRLKRQKENVT